MANKPTRSCETKFPERLTEVWRETDLPITRFASSLGYDRKAITDWMNGNTTPHGFTIMKICKQYGVSADWLLGLSTTKNLAA